MSKEFNSTNEKMFIVWNKFKPYIILKEHPYKIKNLEDYSEERTEEINLGWNTRRIQTTPFRINDVYYNVEVNTDTDEVSVPESLFTESEYGIIFRNILPKIKESGLCGCKNLITSKETKLVKNRFFKQDEELNHPKYYYLFTEKEGRFLSLYSLIYIYNFGKEYKAIRRKCRKYLSSLELIHGLESIKEDVKRSELVFRDKLYDVLKPMGVTMEWQYAVHINENMYKLDFYLPDYNMVIEYDEKAHKYRKTEDVKRQKNIEEAYGYNFLRVEESNSHEFNIGLVLNQILKHDINKAHLKGVMDIHKDIKKHNKNIIDIIDEVKSNKQKSIFSRIKKLI